MTKNKPKIIFTAGVFDLCHKGHLNLFNEMKKEVGKTGLVIIILHDDNSTFQNKGKFPVQSYQHRKNNLNHLKQISNVEVCFSQNPKNVFESIIRRNPHCEITFMRGNDWKDAPGIDYLKEKKVKIKYIPYTKGISSTKLRKKLEK